MDKNKFIEKLNTLQEVEPDTTDLHMIEIAKNENDDTSISLSDFKSQVEYSGKISLRLPKTLHKELVFGAKSEGVSLNQYLLYKLSH